MKITLLIHELDAQGKRTRRTASVEGAQVCWLGRENEELSLSDSFCSRQHAVLFLDFAGEVRLRDLGSRNGTFLGGQRIEDSALKEGDEITIGMTQLEVLGIELPEVVS